MAEEDVTEWAREIFVGGAVPQALRESSNNTNALLGFLDAIQVVEAKRWGSKRSRIIVRFPVLLQYLNPGGTLQGGLQTAMFDVCTSWLAILVADFETGSWSRGGVSRNLNTTYLRPALLGEVLLMECDTVHVGKRLMQSRAELKREKDGALISTCIHDKYNNELEASKI